RRGWSTRRAPPRRPTPATTPSRTDPSRPARHGPPPPPATEGERRGRRRRQPGRFPRGGPPLRPGRLRGGPHSPTKIEKAADSCYVPYKANMGILRAIGIQPLCPWGRRGHSVSARTPPSRREEVPVTDLIRLDLAIPAEVNPTNLRVRVAGERDV